MIPILGADTADQISLEFAKYLLVGMGVALIGVSGFAVFLAKKVIDVCAAYAGAMALSTQAVKENTEVLRERQE